MSVLIHCPFLFWLSCIQITSWVWFFSKDQWDTVQYGFTSFQLGAIVLRTKNQSYKNEWINFNSLQIWHLSLTLLWISSLTVGRALFFLFTSRSSTRGFMVIPYKPSSANKIKLYPSEVIRNYLCHSWRDTNLPPAQIRWRGWPQ